MAGREPRQRDDSLTVAECWTLYLEAAELRVANGDMRRNSWVDTRDTGQLVASRLGRHTPVRSLRVIDFEQLATWLRSRYALATVKGHIARTKAVFKWAYEVEALEAPVRFGPNFRPPSAAAFRKHRAAQGERLLSADEVHRVVEASNSTFAAIVMLGINAAFGNRDCGELEFRHLDLDNGWVQMPRTKNGIPRRAKLWPETVDAIRRSLDKRRDPPEPYVDRVFLTKARGPWAKEESRDFPVSNEFAKIRRRVGIEGHRGFYCLRHTFRTIADESSDQPAVMYVMGHVDQSISGVYRERIADHRLAAMAELVRRWYLTGSTEETGAELRVVGEDASRQTA